MERKKVRILSIDGGGIRGILPATIIRYIEKQIQIKTKNRKARIADYFDMIAGTSTGGILTCLYLTPGPNGRPKYSATDALNLYRNKGHQIFERSMFDRILRGDGLLDEKYSSEGLDKNAEDYFGETMLSDFLKPCLITAYDFRKRKAKLFTSADAYKEHKDFRVQDVARATSAAPTYFEPVKVYSKQGAPWSLVDGGVYANNPTLCAYSEARGCEFSNLLADECKPDKPSAKDMLIVSIGTGSEHRKYHFSKMKDAGLVSWVKPVIDILMSSNSETTHYHLKKIFDTLDGDDKKDYHRLEPSIHNADADMDNAKKENLKNLYEAGLVFIDEHIDEIDGIIDKLILHD